MLVKFYNFFDTLKNSPVKKNKLIIWFTIIALIINLCIWVFLFFQLKKIFEQTPQISALPLHYNVYFGIDLYGKPYRLYLMPMAGLLIWLLNSVLTVSLYSKKILSSYFLTFTSFLSQIFLAVATYLTILINL